MHAAVTVAARDHVEAEGCRIFAKVLHGAAIDPDLSVAKVSRREVTATEAERAAQRAAYQPAYQVRHAHTALHHRPRGHRENDQGASGVPPDERHGLQRRRPTGRTPWAAASVQRRASS